MKKHTSLKKRLCFFLVFLLTGGNLISQPIDLQTAVVKAQLFLKQKGLRLETDFINATPTAYSGFYILNSADNQGFVIVSAEEHTVSVLGYSDKGTFDATRMPVHVRQWLDMYEQDIQAVRSGEISADADSPEYITSDGKNLSSVDPLINTRWDQGQYYNNLCPADAAFNSDEYLAGHVCTGCTNTAMAQVMKYWSWPVHGYGSHSFSWDNDPWTDWNYGTLSADFENTVYDWENMPEELTSSSTMEQVNAVSTLMYQCGVANESFYNSYGDGSTGAYVLASDLYPDYGYTHCAELSLVDYFGYKSTATGYSKRDFPTDTWTQMLKNEFIAGRPVIYQGESGGWDSYGHCFILDGYDDQSRFHINWGWSGEYDGYYSLSALKPDTYCDFSHNQGGIFFVEPEYATSITNQNIDNNNFINVYGCNRLIHVLSAEGQTVYVYDLVGKCLVEKTCTGGHFKIPVNQSGIYIVRINKKIKKVIIN